MGDMVGAAGGGAGPPDPERDDARYEWIDLDVAAVNWWEIVDHPAVAERGTDGWVFYSCTSSLCGEDRVVLTYYRRIGLAGPHEGYLRWASTSRAAPTCRGVFGYRSAVDRQTLTRTPERGSCGKF